MHVNDDEKLLRLIKIKIFHLRSDLSLGPDEDCNCFNMDSVCDCDSHILSIDLHS